MRYDRVILGENAVYSTDCSETGINNNVLVCGGSGSGKTMSIAEPRLLETKNLSLICTVSKRRIVNKYKTMFVKRGYDFLDLNFANPNEGNISFDFLRYVSGYSDVKYLAEAIVKANPLKNKSYADPYWDETAAALLSAEILYVLTIYENPTFVDVLKLNESLTIDESGSLIKTSLDCEFGILAENDPNSYLVTCWNSFKKLPIKTASCVYGTLNNALEAVFTPELRNSINDKKPLDIEQLGQKKTVLFVTTSAVNNSSNYFVNIFYSLVFKKLFEYAEHDCVDGALPVPVHMLCDDFAVGSRIYGFEEHISIFREKGISVTILLQSESQLEEMYGKSATTIINNCDTYLYMGGMDLNTCRHVSERATPPLDEVMYMPVGEMIIFRRGARPLVTKRYDISKDEIYRKITDQNKRRNTSRERS